MGSSKKHPYVPSPGILIQVFEQFRKIFPQRVDAETLKKLSLATKNESVVLATLKFLGFVDKDGNKTDLANDVFLKHIDSEFEISLQSVVKAAYLDLFELTGDDAWKTERDTLINFFRVQDETSDLTAKRQATTFEALVSLCGLGKVKVKNKAKSDAPSSKKTSVPKKQVIDKKSVPPIVAASTTPIDKNTPIGLTVRIEINLPAQGDQDTYDRIFESIKKNLLNG